MAFEQRNNQGAMFFNDKKKTDAHPDRSGRCMVDGKMYWLAGWIKQGQNGDWLSLAFTPMEESGEEDQRPEEERQPQRPAPKPQTRKPSGGAPYLPRNEPNDPEADVPF